MGDVTIVASPRYTPGGRYPITLVSPDHTRDEVSKLGNKAPFVIGEYGAGLAVQQGDAGQLPRLRFRILKGHTIGNLTKHRNVSISAYAGLAAIGTLTISKGIFLMKYNLQHNSSS